MELGELLLLIHTIGHAASIPTDADLPAPKSRWFPVKPTTLANDIRSAIRRLTAAMEIIDHWPAAFQLLLDDLGAHQRTPKDRLRAGRVFSSRAGAILEYPPRGLDGYPLAPILTEVSNYYERRGVESGSRLRPGFLLPDAVTLRGFVTPAALARDADVASSNQHLVDRAFKRVILELSEEDRSLPVSQLAERVRVRTLDRYSILLRGRRRRTPLGCLTGGAT